MKPPATKIATLASNIGCAEKYCTVSMVYSPPPQTLLLLVTDLKKFGQHWSSSDVFAHSEPEGRMEKPPYRIYP
jgi:hypothetical protein